MLLPGTLLEYLMHIGLSRFVHTTHLSGPILSGEQLMHSVAQLVCKGADVQ